MKYLEAFLAGKTLADKCQAPSAKSAKNNTGTFVTDPSAPASACSNEKVEAEGTDYPVPKVTKIEGAPYEG
jgi:hypothetical protein